MIKNQDSMTDSSSYLHIPTIPRDFVVQIVAHLNVQRQLPEVLQIKLTKLLNCDKVTIAQYNDFYQGVQQALSDEMIGLFPAKVPLLSQQVLCQMLCHSPDVYTALENYNRFYSLFFTSGEQLLDLSKLRSNAQITVNSSSLHSQQPMFQQTIILALLKIPAWLTGRKISPKVISFCFSAMEYTSEFNYLFGISPSYDCRNTVLEYKKGDLNSPIQLGEDPSSYGENFIFHTLYWSQKDEIARCVYAQISQRLSAGTFDVIQIAAQFNMSKHTLARRLKSGDTSYGQLLERVRRDIALHLLLNSQHSNEYIATSLGFKEVGSFSRAFKRWCNCSPSHYRESQKINATNC